MTTKRLSLILFIFIATLAISCRKDAAPAKTDSAAIPAAIISQIKNQGFSTEDVRAVPGGYIVEGDIFLSAKSLSDTSKVGKYSISVANTEQYSTQNLISSLPRTITIAVDAGLSQNIYDGTDMALARWNALGLNLHFQRVSSSSDLRLTLADLGGYVNGSIVLGNSSNFPDSFGNASGTITLNNQYYTSSFDVSSIASVIQHELGHAVGLRHTDYYNRSISAGQAVQNPYEGLNYNGSYIGAVLIPGSPGKAVASANSFMLAYNNVGNRTFNSDDIIALNYLYHNGTQYPVPFYRLYDHNVARHFYTIDYGEIGSTIGNFNDEGSLGKIYAKPFSGTVPLYRYFGNKDHLYQTTYASISGYTYEGVAGYVWTSAVANSIPVYRFYRANAGHFYTTSYSEGINNSYSYEGIAFYVLNN